MIRAQAVADLIAPHVAGTIELCPDWNPSEIGAALQNADVLVNTTSMGMHPNENEMPPVPLDALRPGLFVTDLIYRPGRNAPVSRRPTKRLPNPKRD